MSEELKPCPFCGGEGLLHRTSGKGKVWRVSCKNCDAAPSGSLGEDGRSAIQKWNTRAETPQSIPSEREEIVAYLKALAPDVIRQADSDYSQGVLRGFEICIAQIERGEHLTRQALEQGSAE